MCNNHLLQEIIAENKNFELWEQENDLIEEGLRFSDDPPQQLDVVAGAIGTILNIIPILVYSDGARVDEILTRKILRGVPCLTDEDFSIVDRRGIKFVPGVRAIA